MAIEKNCLIVSLREKRVLKSIKPTSKIPASNILDAVRKRGGQCSRVIFPIENMLDQVAYIRMTVSIDMRKRVSGGSIIV